MRNFTHSTWIEGDQALRRKDAAAADAAFRRVLSVDPGHVPSLLGLSTVLTQRGHHRDARDAALRAFDLRPPAAPLLYAIAQRLLYFHEYEHVVACLREPAFGTAAPADIVAKGAVMLSLVGAHGEAARLAEQGLRRKPTDAACLHVRGNQHLFRGEVDKAEACYEASLQADPLLFQNSLMLTDVRPATAERNLVDRIHGQSRKARPGGNGEIYLGFALHKQLHQLGRYEEAWDALRHACAAKRRQIRYSIAADEALVAKIREVCTPDFLAATSRVEQPSVPVFIVGMHRSGTTLLERMLAGHSNVGDAGETLAFHASMEMAHDRASPQGADAAFAAAACILEFDRVAVDYARRAKWLSRGKPVFTEKLPQNFLNIGFIAKAMPQARFLHLVRDPMDTCFSNLRQMFSGAALYSYDQAELGRFYLLYRRMMAHWRDVLPGRVLDISYDGLIEDPEKMARRVAAHCGLAFEPSMLDISRSSGTVATPSATTARQGFHGDRGQVWRRYERHLDLLQLELRPAYAETLPV